MSGGSITGTASFSENSGLLSNLDSGSFVGTGSFNTVSSSFSTVSSSFVTVSSSYSAASGSLSTRVTKIEGNYATTGSNVFTGAQTVCANITSTGTIIAQTLNVQQVTSSIVYSSGSNIFGCSLTDIQQMTGSVRITGSLNTIGNTCVTSICSPAFIGGTISGTTIYGSTAICGTCAGFSCGDTGVGTKTLIQTIERTGASPSATPREVGLVFKDGNNPTIVGGITGVRSNSAGNYYGGLKFYVNTSSGVSATSFSDLITALTIDYVGVAAFTSSVYASRGIFDSDFLQNETCKVGISFASGYAQINSWGANVSTFGGIKFQSSVSNGNTQTPLIITPSLNVGIGETSPASKLSIGGTQGSTIGSNVALLVGNSGASGTVGNMIQLGLHYNPAGATPASVIGAVFTSTVGYTKSDIFFATRDVTTDTAPTERMRVTSAGRVGIGTCNPTEYKLQVEGTDSYTGMKVRNTSTACGVWGILDIRNNCNDGLQIGSVGNAGYSTSTNFYNSTYIESYNQRLNLRTYNDFGITIGTNSSVRMCILNTGETTFACQICVGGTVTVPSDVAGAGGYKMNYSSLDTSSRSWKIANDLRAYGDFWIGQSTTQTSTSYNYILYVSPGGVTCFSGTVCAPCFATISDYRMKSNLRPIEGLSIIMNTKPYKFEYNYDCSTSFGMIAHELQETLPEAVFGVKDGEAMQGVDYMKLLPIAIKAIQEQQCEIKQLKSCLGIN